ncbi:unnamed protein product [Caenorhabditis angaria]|uniref:C-type lectin domain-containing protein n=1 Tax=Caenorhabditis angaria TaxID=860376 RepID=A0A9P1IUH2_9PELO|nr:unnamed protein product [Caenorhabditis angaria]
MLPIFLISLFISSTNSCSQVQKTWRCLDATWTLFNRGSYSWCIRPAYGMVPLGNASSLCQDLDSSAVLTGFQDLTELSKMSQEVANHNDSIVYMAIGAVRSDNCKTTESLSTASCTPSNMFVWTDGKTTGSAGFNWLVRQPNGCFEPGCSASNWVVIYPGYSGKMDDFWEDWLVNGAICGMEAIQN